MNESATHPTDPFSPADLSGLTVAVCTRNRADLLAGAVRSVLAQETDGFALDVLVVDNGSTDRTPEILRGLQDGFPSLRAVAEPRAGLSIARNRALAEARHDVVAFVDDDALLPPGYAKALLDCWRERRPGAAGGPIATRYLDEPPPGWNAAHEIMRGPYNKGDAPRRLAFGEYPEGCNIAFDRRLALAAGGFDERLGVRPESPWAAEEIELAAWLDRHGYAVWYCPAARVTHRLERGERDARWLRRMAYYRGRSHVYSLRARHGRVRWRPFLRMFLSDAATFFPWHTAGRGVRTAMAWGKLVEATRLLLRRELECPRPALPSRRAEASDVPGAGYEYPDSFKKGDADERKGMPGG